MNKQRGQATILIIVLILIAGIFFLQSIKVGTSSSTSTDNCYITPVDVSRGVVFQGVQYDLLRDTSAISTEQFKWHIETNLPTVTYEGAVRKVYKAKTLADSEQQYPNDWHVTPKPGDDSKPASITFDPGALNLIFLDVSSDVSDQVPGYTYVKVFIRDDQKNHIPDFILNYCNAGNPTNAIKIFPGPDGNQFPPARITKADTIASNLVQEGETYTLFAYESMHSPAAQAHVGGRGRGRIEIPKGSGKFYDLGSASFAGYLSLFDDSNGIIYLYSKNIPAPSPTPTNIDPKNTLQLKTFDVSTLFPWGWWSPECKPALYLYPEKTTTVHVAVEPKGFLTYTKPNYPVTGWDAVAQPSGQLTVGNSKYDYLYYESKIEDSAIEKPKDGFVVSYDDLPRLYSDILPKLGLNEKETKDFKDYWEKALTRAPYYFVGIMSSDAVNKIEPLTISPKPATIIRVRLFFQALDKKIEVRRPTIVTPKRDGFTAVEWGGLVKNDQNHPFTCSQ